MVEKWITPSLFAGVTGSDEHSLSTDLPCKDAKRRLDQHRSTFITEEHIAEIKQLGLNAIRVPVGYWLFEDVDGFIGGSSRYLDKLFEWASRYDLQILLCLHGAPGSQNGWDHSGRAGNIQWADDVSYLERTLEVIRRICERYGSHEQLHGIELMNEPHPTLSLRKLTSYYRKGMYIVRQVCRPNVRVVLSDAFRPRRMACYALWHWRMKPVLDQHMYQVFSKEDRKLDWAGHETKTLKWRRELKWRNRCVQVLVGEWSAAVDDINCSELEAHDYERYAFTQRKVFEASGVGWFYWTARTEDKGVWSLLDHHRFIEK